MKTTLLLIIPMALLSAATNSDRPIAATAAFEKLKTLAGIPHVLFEAVMQDVGAPNRWVGTRDGQKFLVVGAGERKPGRQLPCHPELAVAITAKVVSGGHSL